MEEAGEMNTPPLLEGTYAEAKPGHCALCDGVLPPPLRASGRQRKICPVEECQKTYQRLFAALKRERRRGSP